MFKKLSLLVVFLLWANFSFALPYADFVPGGVAVFLLPHDDAQITGYFQNQRILVLPGKPNDILIVGIPLSLHPGKQNLQLKMHGNTYTLPFTVNNKNYPVQRLFFAVRKGAGKGAPPSPTLLKRLEQERAVLIRLFASFTRQFFVDTQFILPVHGIISSQFGLRREINHIPKMPHTGLDIAVPKNTPIHVVSDGKVLQTGHFMLPGKFVVVDHGQGLITFYCHMNSIAVTNGQKVSKGQVIGYVGTTGRSTGPHLHFGVLLNSTNVNPLLFFSKEDANRLKGA